RAPRAQPRGPQDDPARAHGKRKGPLPEDHRRDGGRQQQPAARLLTRRSESTRRLLAPDAGERLKDPNMSTRLSRAAAHAAALLLAACASSGGLEPKSATLDPATLQANRTLAG